MLAKVASANTGGHTNYVALIYEVSNVSESTALKDTHGHNTNSSLHKVGGCVNYFPMPAWKIHRDDNWPPLQGNSAQLHSFFLRFNMWYMLFIE